MQGEMKQQCPCICSVTKREAQVGATKQGIFRPVQAFEWPPTVREPLRYVSRFDVSRQNFRFGFELQGRSLHVVGWDTQQTMTVPAIVILMKQYWKQSCQWNRRKVQVRNNRSAALLCRKLLFALTHFHHQSIPILFFQCSVLPFQPPWCGKGWVGGSGWVGTGLAWWIGGGSG